MSSLLSPEHKKNLRWTRQDRVTFSTLTTGQALHGTGPNSELSECRRWTDHRTTERRMLNGFHMETRLKKQNVERTEGQPGGTYFG